jgi:hypothetical protein
LSAHDPERWSRFSTGSTCPALPFAPGNGQHRTVIAESWNALRAGSSCTALRHAVADHLSISSLTERLADVTALAVTQAACRRAPVSPAVTLRPAGNAAPANAAAHHRRY